MKLRWNNILMDAAGEGTGGGGAGSGGGNGSLITNGGQQQDSAKAGGAGAASGGAGGNDSGTGGNNSGAAATDWRSTLPKELQEDASLKKFTSVHALASSYLSAQKLIGADKIHVPGAHTTDEQWKDIYKKLGVPDKVEDYKVTFKEGAGVQDDFAKEFLGKAFGAGILPKQAQALADWFSEATVANQTKYEADAKANFDKMVGELKKDWGNSYDLNVARANKVVKELGGDELANHFAQSGLGADGKILRFLATVGEKMFAEHKFVEGQGAAGAMSPKELDAEIAKLKADPAYFDKNHPKHKVVVAEMADLFKKRYNS